MNAQQRGWGDPYSSNYFKNNIITIEIDGISLLVHKEVARLFIGFINDLLKTGYRLDVNKDDWGYARRCVRGTGSGTGKPCVLSNHSWGLAIDLNAIDNPMTKTLITNMPSNTSLLASNWGLRWGGNYTGTYRDAMHFEFMGRPQDVTLYPKNYTEPITPEELMARIPGAVGFAILHNDDLVITTNDGAIYHFDSDGVPDATDYKGSYNNPANSNLWGGASPTANRECLGVYAINPNGRAVPNGDQNALGYCQVFDDIPASRYRWL